MKEKGLEELVKEKYPLHEAAISENVEAVKAIIQDGKRKDWRINAATILQVVLCDT